MQKEILSPREAAEFLSVSPSTLAHMRMNRSRKKDRGPKFFYVGSQVRYRLADLNAYVAARVAEATN